jgi:hypothetical protein
MSAPIFIRPKMEVLDVCGSGGVAPPFMTSALDEGEWSASRPGRFTLWKENQKTSETIACFVISLRVLRKPNAGKYDDDDIGSTYVSTGLSRMGPGRLLHGLTLLTCIRDVTGSNLGRDTGHTDSGLSWCFSAPQENAGIILQIWLYHFLSYHFRFIIR